MFDKLLILLLIISFPIAAYIAHEYILDDPAPTPTQAQAMQKLDTLITELKDFDSQSASQEQGPEISLTTVFYATDSGKFLVSGVAPRKNVQIMASIIPNKTLTLKDVTLKKSATASAQPTQAEVLGQSVDVRAIPVTGDGTFTFTYLVPEEKLDSLEIRLDQAKSSKTILYYFSSGKFEEF